MKKVRNYKIQNPHSLIFFSDIFSATKRRIIDHNEKQHFAERLPYRGCGRRNPNQTRRERERFGSSGGGGMIEGTLWRKRERGLLGGERQVEHRSDRRGKPWFLLFSGREERESESFDISYAGERELYWASIFRFGRWGLETLESALVISPPPHVCSPHVIFSMLPPFFFSLFIYFIISFVFIYKLASRSVRWIDLFYKNNIIIKLKF